MKNAIIFDLEGVLIDNLNSHPIRQHPQAEIVLKKSKEDFDKTVLWTLAPVRKAYDYLENNALIRYFNVVIGVDDGFGEWLAYGIENAVHNGRKKYFARNLWNKSLIKIVHNVQELDRVVLIEDDGLGIPLKRTVQINSYNGEPNHSLLEPYRQALIKIKNKF